MKMKKFIAGITLIIMLSVILLGNFPAVLADEGIFTDVSSSTPYAYEIQALSELGILSGYPDGSFKPENTITRAEFTKIICRFLAYEDQALSSTPFADVESNHWASGYIALASGQNIINGIGDGMFAPEDNVTRIQSIKMILASGGYVANYPDGYSALATEKEIWQDNHDMDIPLTRGLAAQYLYNALPVEFQGGKGMRFLDKIIGPIEMDAAMKELVYSHMISFTGFEVTSEGIVVRKTQGFLDKVVVGGETMNLRDIMPHRIDEDVYLYQLAYITGLDELYVDETITDISCTRYMPNLCYLNIENQDVTDLTPVFNPDRWSTEFIEDYEQPYRAVQLYGNEGMLDVSVLRNTKTFVKSFPYEKLSKIASQGNTVVNDDLDQYEKLMDKAYDIIDEIITPDMSQKEMIYEINDYLVDHIIYDLEYAGTYWKNYYALIDGKAVCDGYASAFYLICTLLDIPCSYEFGDIPMSGSEYGHSWNKVIVKRKKWGVDVTWNDSSSSEKYCLMDEALFDVDRDEWEDMRITNNAWDKAIEELK